LVPTSETINQLYMHCSDFRLLDLPLQANTICQRGIYLSERVQDDCFIALYRVHDFYVEVYCRFRDNNIIKLVPYHGDTCLEPYLSKISLDGILTREQLQ
jgi:hypothetical protein